MRNRLIRLGFILVILLPILLSGANAQAKERVVFWYGATQAEAAAYNSLIAEFNRTHPNIEVIGMPVPQAFIERKLILSVAGGVPPDVVRFYTHLGGEMMSRGGLEPLDDLIARDNFDMSDFYPIGIEQNTYQGKLYGIPWVLSPNALMYNKKLFRKAGLDPNKPPTTWKELEEYALKLTIRDDRGGFAQVGYADFLNNPANFHLYLWQTGGNPLTPDMKRTNFTSPESIEALTWMRDFMIREVGGPTKGLSTAEASALAVRNLQTFQSGFAGATQDPFGMEKVAMRIDSPFRIPDLMKYFPDLEIGIAAPPYNKVKTLEVVGNSLIIPKGSKHREAAWEFIKFAASKEGVLGICNYQNTFAGRIPARISAATAPEFYSNPLVKPFVDLINYGRTTPVAPGYREVSDTLTRKIEDALKGNITPQAAMQQASVEGQEKLDAANEDVSKYHLIPWITAGIIAGAVLVLSIVVGIWYILRQTKGSRIARREAFNFYLFLSPWLVGFIILTFGSTVASFIFSFSRWDILSPARFVGFDNFAQLALKDPRFIKALGNTLYYAVFSIPLAMVGGLAISVLLNQKIRGIKVFRTIYYLPVVVSGVATALLWQWIFNPSNGFIGRLIGPGGRDIFGLHIPPGWLIDPAWAKPAFILMSLWGVGGAMVIYLAGLQGIPEEFYEAAKIDGANAWQKFKNVTLPLLTPTIFYQLIIGTMAAFQFFTQVYIMTNGRGGPEDATMFYSLYLFKNAFEWMKMGYASAMAWILFMIVLIITLIQFKFANRWVYYEGKKEG